MQNDSDAKLSLLDILELCIVILHFEICILHYSTTLSLFIQP